jgi:TolB-like protein
VITADAHRIALTADLAETDIVEFERLLSRGDVASLETATELLRGEFAAGLHINEPPFEDWIANERRRVSELAIAALGRLLTHYEDRNDPDKTAFLAAKLLAIDPLQERVHQSFMRARADQDRFESALQQYKICRDLLRKELAIEPSEAMRALQAEIVRRREAVRHAPTAPAVETGGLLRILGDKPSGVMAVAADMPPQLQGLDLTVPERPSIVILPFENLTGDADSNHLAEGVRIDIQAALIKITGIFIIAAGSANAMRGRDTISAGKALGVSYVLQGSLRRSGPRLRMSAELIDVHSGNAIWTDSYDRQFDDGFEVQDEIIG